MSGSVVPPSPVIVTFDSGLGGLTVYREVVKARPDARHIYIADDARFPYGRIPEDELTARVVEIIGRAIAAFDPSVVVIACNTASTIALPALRERFSVKFVGTVPAIKPACAGSVTKRVAVLGTEATVGREYTRKLIQDFAQGCDVVLVGSARLATFAEQELRGAPVEDRDIAAEIAPCFIGESGRRTDTVTLACTHYPLLIERLTRLAPWPVTWIDPAPAIARRVLDLLGPASAARPTEPPRAIFTTQKPPSEALKAGLARLGLTRVGGFDTPALSA